MVGEGGRHGNGKSLRVMGTGKGGVGGWVMGLIN